MVPANPVLWEPAPARSNHCALARFADYLLAQGQGPFADYAGLQAWSVAEPAAFWAAVAAFADLRFVRRAGCVVDDPMAMPGARWFAGATLNLAAVLLRFHDDRPALVWRDEAGARRELSYRELHASVAAAQAGLRRAGLAPGDRVAALLPNQPEAVVAMLAVTAAGGIWTSCSPDFGADALLERFGQVRPRLLIATDGYRYAGRSIDVRPTVAALAAALDTVEQVVIVPGNAVLPTGEALPGAVGWHKFIDPSATVVDCPPLPFDHPVYILYSSGTTGKPKCIVHGAGGTLLQHLKEHLLHVDLRRDDRLFYFTTCGWMMWNWLVSGLASGATLLLYEGSPMHPDPGVLWRMAAEEGITIFGTSARYLAGLQQAGYQPRARHELPRLRTLLSTGSPLLPESFDYVYRDIAPDIHLASIAGGTDLLGCFLIGNPRLPVRRGEIQCAALGMAVEVFAAEGQPLATGRGELVCTRAFPSMPLGFWDDPGGARYRQAYFHGLGDDGRAVWWHGDDVERLASGGWVIHGRADAVLNPGGVRIGTAEIYRQLTGVPEVAEGLAIGQAWQGDTRIVLFVQLVPGAVLDDALRERIRARIRAGASPRHVPARILAVPDLPRTRSGKLCELAVRAVVHGQPPGNLAAMANPECLAAFSDRAELAG
jgi:acetoacetyl-CoA synthetase